MKLTSGTLLFVILCSLFKYGSTIMCYECNSALNSHCFEKIPPPNLKRNCSELDRGVTHTLCRKIVQHVEYGVNGQLPSSRVIRSCGWDDTKYKGACYHRSGFGGKQEVCSCTTDLCNSASDVTAITSLVLSSVFMVFRMIVCA